MPGLPKAGAELELLSSSWDRQFNQAISDGARIDSMFDDMADSARQVGHSLDGLDSVDVKVNIADNEVRSLLDLSSATLTPKIDPTLNDAPVKMVNDLDSATLDPKIDAQETASSREVTERLHALAVMQAIEIALNVSGTAVEFVNKISQISGLSGIFEIDSALAKIQARTGEMIPDAERLILELYQNGWGESRDQIADVITQADNLRISTDDLHDAVENALIIQSVYGEDTSEILRTMDSLVKNELAKNFDEAADIIVTGLQNGANRGQDLLDTFNEYGTTFGNLRISGEGALALINSGLRNGIDNSDRVADSIRELGIRLGEIHTDPNIQGAFYRLDAMSDIDLSKMLKAFEKGEITGDEFFEGFFQAVSDAAETNPVKAQELVNQIIGTQAEDFKLGAFVGLTTAWDDTMGTLEGRAQEAGNAISSDLNSQFNEMWRSVEVAAQEFLSSEQIDLPGKLDAIKQGLTQAVDVIQSGGTIGEALEVGFQIQGVDEFIQRFEGAMGNFVISILQVVATLQEVLPGGSTGEGTRAEISRLGAEQLAFDLKIANPDEVAGMLQTATERGVEAAAVGEAARTAVEEMLAAGNVGAAQDLIDQIRLQGTGFTLSPELNPSFGRGVGIQTALNKWIAEGNLDMINQAIEDGLIVEPDSIIDIAVLQGQVAIATEVVKDEFDRALSEGNVVDVKALGEKLGITPEAFQEMFTQALAEGNINLAETIVEAIGGEVMQEELEVAKEAMGDMADQSIYSAERMTEALRNSRSDAVDNFRAIAGAAQDADKDIFMAVSGGSIVPEFIKIRDTAMMTFPLVIASEAALSLASQKYFGNVSSWAEIASDSLMKFGDVLPILDLLVAKLNQASSAASTANATIQAAQGAAGGNSYTVNNNINVANMAQADAAGYSTAQQVRGL